MSAKIGNSRYFRMIGALAACHFALGPSSGAAQGPSTGQPNSLNRLEKAASEVIAATLNYRATLERLLPIYERELARRSEHAELRQELYERGALSRSELEALQKTQVEAQKNIDETRHAIVEADRMLTEARMAEALARLTPLPRGSYEETPGLARFNGPATWSLSVDTPRLQHFFLARFGRALPISAFGQTALHGRMGFDHRNALDVALHPDSPEGRGLMEYLRASGIPFIASWGAIPGSASGAHIHVGQPSPRIAARR